MNGNDISTLSYKELQALALRYRVPGNIKKKLLVKVLQAAKGGNENEVDRLLQDLKQNRKKKVRKLKAQKLGLTSTPLHSPDYVMADDYYCPQQQPPYQWVGAEEEIVSRDDDRIPHYEEFKQFLLRRIQKEFQTYDTNNNQIQEPTIVDLRTVNASPNIETDPIDIDNYSRSNIIAVHNADSFVYQSHDQVEYQTLEDTNNNVQGSILLKKMLQAPVGANLEEIASPMLGSYRVWSVEQCQSNNVLDNSDTLTAESDNQDNEGNMENNLECYGLLNTIKGTYFLNEPTFVNNVEEIGEQISTVLSNESENSYRCSSMNNNKRENYTNWTISNVTETVDGNCAMSHGQPSKIFQTMYYDTTGSENLSKPVQDENLNCQYHMAEMVHPYNANQHLMNSNPPVESQYYDGNIISNIQSDTSNTYYLQNFVKYNGGTTGEYIQNVHSLTNVNMEQDTYPSTISQTFQTSNNHYNSGVSSEYPYVHFNQENNATLSENVEQQENCNSTVRNESSIHKDTTLERVQTLNGILDPFRPKRLSSNPSDSSLENILNLYNSKRIDLSKLDQTSCVYCYIAPIVTHTPVLSNSACSQKERFVAEYRQHSFSPYWLLYNDTSCGMRMSNLQMTPSEAIIGEDKILHTSSLNNNADLRESNEENDVSISKVWAHNYTNYEMEVEKDPNICEDINVEVTDCLFSVITTEPLISQVDSIIMSQP